MKSVFQEVFSTSINEHVTRTNASTVTIRKNTSLNAKRADMYDDTDDNNAIKP